MASPLTAHKSTEISTSNEYIELYREKASTGGALVYYGPVGGTKTLRSEAAKVEERAPRTTCRTTTAPKYSTSKSARNDICDALVTELQGDGQIGVGLSPCQIYYKGAAAETNQYYCVSWRKAVPGLIKSDLFGYANTSKQTIPLSLLLASGRSS